jgi:hypothetical protein
MIESSHEWLTTVILAIKEEEIRRVAVQSQLLAKTLSCKSPLQKRAGGVAQGVESQFKSQHHTHKKKI